MNIDAAVTQNGMLPSSKITERDASPATIAAENSLLAIDRESIPCSTICRRSLKNMGKRAWKVWTGSVFSPDKA